jgi:hypothetical protein
MLEESVFAPFWIGSVVKFHPSISPSPSTPDELLSWYNRREERLIFYGDAVVELSPQYQQVLLETAMKTIRGGGFLHFVVGCPIRQ